MSFDIMPDGVAPVWYALFSCSHPKFHASSWLVIILFEHLFIKCYVDY